MTVDASSHKGIRQLREECISGKFWGSQSIMIREEPVAPQWVTYNCWEC